MTCNDQPPAGPDSTRQPRATYLVYAAYGNTSGVMIPVTRHCDYADALASYDLGDPGGHSSAAWLVVGNYVSTVYPDNPATPAIGGPNRTVHLRLSGLPATLVHGEQTTVTLAKIPNSLQLAVPRPLPMETTVHRVTQSAAFPLGFDLDLQLVITNHDVWTVRVLRPVP